MRKLVLSALLTSSTLVTLADSAFAKDCPPLNVKEITVDESSEPIKLRTNPATEEQTIPNSEGENAVINDGEILLIDENEVPQAPYRICFYPVEINQTNNPNNSNKNVLSYKPYWISEKGIKNYDILSKQSGNTAPTPPPNQSPPSPTSRSLPSWLPGMLNLIANLLTLALLVYFTDLQRKKDRNTVSTLDKVTKSFQDQNLKFGKESQDLQRMIGKNKEHIKQLEELINRQNKHLDNLVDYIKSENLSKSISDSLKKAFEVMLESRQSEQNKPGLAPASEQNEASQQETEQTDHYDPFYDQVISQFNAASDSWFSSLIEQRKFGKVQITKDSVLGQMDMGGKVTQLGLNEQGTLLIYKAADKLWVIPDPTQPRWKRYVPNSLFNGNEQTLCNPAEVELASNNLWQLVKKGEFR